MEPLDLAKVTSIDGLVRAMSKTAFTGRQLGEAADVLEAMALDEDAFIVMTLAGAMTVAKQGLIVTELIDRGIVNAIVSTGALMAHGLVEATGRAHFRANPEVSDEELYEQGYNRVYDTLEPEQNLDDVEEVMSAVLEAWDHNEIMCSYKLNHAIGAYLAKTRAGSAGNSEVGIRKGCARLRAGIQRFRMGLDTALNNRLRESTGGTRSDLIHSKILSTLRRLCCGKRNWGSSQSAAACRATGRSNSDRSSNCGIAGWVKTCRSSAITMA